jgi:hypothetical protein
MLTFGTAATAFADEYKDDDKSLKSYNNTRDDEYDDGATITANDYLELEVRDIGRYTIGTTGGNPDISSDDNMMLLYGHRNTTYGNRTTKTTIAVDDNYYVFGSSNYDYNVSETTFNDDATVATTVEQYGDIEVTQVLSFVTNVSTGREDVIEIKYIAKNTGTESHSVGTRIMLDTKLNNNDAAPFRIPGVGAILTEKSFTGSDIPAYWQVFDSLSDTKVVAQGSLLRSTSNPPDEVQFVDWEHVSNESSSTEMWSYEATSGYTYDDSAVTVKWEQTELAPGESKAYTTYYGLSEITQSQGDMSVGMYCDGSVTALTDEETGDVTYEDFDVTGYVENIKDVDLANPYLRIVLPEGFTLAEGQSDTISLGELLAAGESAQASWKVSVSADIAQGYDYPITVVAGADDISETDVSRNISVPGERQEDSSSEPEESSSEAEENSSESSSESSSKSSSSSKASTTTTTGDSNPDTGAVSGIGIALATVLAAGIVVSKKKNK